MAMDKVTKWGLAVVGLGFVGQALALALTPRPGAERDLRGAPGPTQEKDRSPARIVGVMGR